MNYIYDISLNLNKNKLYEFYEWKEEDNPEFILKIPIFKVDEETFLNFKYNNVIVNRKFLTNIQNKTECYSPNCINIIKYACVFTCDKDAIAIEFDSDGNDYMKSNLSLEEENEILDISKNIKYSIIEYKIRNKNKNINNFLTRKEHEIQKKALEKIKSMFENNETLKLKYIFYEVYNEKCDDIQKVYNKLVNVITTGDKRIMKLEKILLLIGSKKIMSNNS